MAHFKIKELCRQRGITMAELAEKVGMSPSALSKSLRNGNPNLHTMEKMAEALNVDFIDIFERQKPEGFVVYEGVNYMINDVHDIQNILNIINKDKKQHAI